MATNPNSPNRPHFPLQEPMSPAQSNPIAPSKQSHSHFLCKSLVVVTFLIVIPFFPSQAPGFVNKTVFTKYWELFHLLFVGIAVSYGLFSRRNVEEDIENQSTIVDNSQINLSRMFHITSIFEDGSENSPGSYEKKMVESENSQYFQGDSMVVVDDQIGPRSLVSMDGLEIPSGFDERNMIQAWNSQYYGSESMVVVASGSHDELGYLASNIGNKPLGLPIRSLRSRILDQESSESSTGSGSDSGSKASYKSSDKARNGKFGDLGSLNVKEKFEETVALPSPIPWRSRSGRVELREEARTVPRSSHSRHFSVEESRFEPLKSRSLRPTGSFSSRTSSMSSSPSKVSSPSSVLSEPSNLKMEELGRKNSSSGTSSAMSPALSSIINDNAPLFSLKTRRFSVGSSSEINGRGTFNDDLKDMDRSAREDSLGSKEWGLGSLKASQKPPTSGKALRGKSVRTFRAGGYTGGASKFGGTRRNQFDDKIGNMCGEAETILMENTGLKTGGFKDQSPGTIKLKLDRACHVQNPQFSTCQKGKRQESHGNSIVESQENSESEGDNFQASSDDEKSTLNHNLTDAGTDHDEVDKKAGEFIAKFREQIRLQKMESMNDRVGCGQQIGRISLW